MSDHRLIGLLALAALASMIAFMTVDAKAPWSFLLPFRGEKLAALILVAVAISTATVLFQTVSYNRVLTPSIMGFDALYVMLLTLATYFLGSAGFTALPPVLVFLVTSAALLLASLALFATLAGSGRPDLPRMILTGLIFGVLFRSLTSFMQRMIDPNEYVVIQVGSYARFNTIETDLLAIAAPITVIALLLSWAMHRRLDVISLGADMATGLGETPRLATFLSLTLIAVLVAVSTAFVGPLAFLGLLVVSLAHALRPTPHHAVQLPVAALVSIIVLVGGQTVLERFLNLTTPLSVVVDVLGGVVFLWIVLRGPK